MQNTRVKGTSNTEKQIAIFEVIDKETVNVYLNNGYKTISTDMFKELRSNPLTSPVLLVKKNTVDETLKQLSLKEQYKVFISNADKLKTLTDGRVNLYKTGSVSKTSLQLFYSFNPPVAEYIEKYETKILESCYKGALIYGIPYSGYAYKYDIVSQYPSIMRSDHMQFPNGKGELKTFTAQEFSEMKFFRYGIYHIKIVDPDFRLLKENSNNFYTHIDLNRAMELKYKLELIEDGEPNALLYTKLVNGAKLFRPFVDYLFKFKQDGEKCVKPILNALWGVLCKTDIMAILLDESDTIFENKEIISLRPMSNDLEDTSGKLRADIAKKEKLYENSYARIKPFLTAKGRFVISKIAEKNLENVVWVHTDGIILKKPIKDVPLGTELGMLKYEGESHCKIVNSINKTWYKSQLDEINENEQKHLTLRKQMNLEFEKFL